MKLVILKAYISTIPDTLFGDPSPSMWYKYHSEYEEWDSAKMYGSLEELVRFSREHGCEPIIDC